MSTRANARTKTRVPLALVVIPAGEGDAAIVASVIEDLGFRAQVHNDAGTALDAVEYDRPALVVHGWDLPDMDAITFHGAVHQRSAGRTVLTLAIAPDPMSAERLAGSPAGSIETIVRPFESEHLVARLAELAARAWGGAAESPAASPSPARETPLPERGEATVHEMKRADRAASEVRPAAKAPAPEPARIEDTARPARETQAAPAASARGSAAAPTRKTPAPSQQKEREMKRTERQARPEGVAPAFGWRVIGLGEWGVRGAELFDRHGVPARGVDIAATVERSGLPAGRRHRIAAFGDHAASARALASDKALADALADDAEAELFVVVADLGVGAGSLAATMLARIAEIAPRAGRHVVARLPGTRSGPEERALSLVALNAVLQGPASGIFLVQPPDGLSASDADADPAAPLYRLLELWSLASGESPDPIQALNAPTLGRFLATTGFLGWRETGLTTDDVAPDGRGWHELLAAAPWQPQGFSWGEAQAVLPLAKMPWAWLEGGGRRQFERFVQAAWDEAAPCAMIPALYAAEPSSAVLVSAGMPYPRGVLTLRDSVEADRARLLEKRRKAETPIPLGEDFLPQGLDVMVAQAVADLRGLTSEPAREVAPAEPARPRLEVEIERTVTTWEVEVAASDATSDEAEPTGPDEVVIDEEEPAWESPAWEDSSAETWRVREEEAWSAAEPEVREPAIDRPALAALEAPAVEPGSIPPAYEAALGIVRKIFAAKDLRSEVDLGEVRYGLYDLLEVLREEPHGLLPEVFRPDAEEWFERHHVNVAVLAILTGDLLKGSLSEVIDLGTAALLHDIGMLPVRETWDVEVRLPPTVFDRAIRLHPETGFRRLQEINGMTGPIARMVLEEHERMDGTGYPEGLAGESIDPGARILAVCDTLEALTHPRPYRDHLSPGEALARLQILGQYTLDPAVVQALTGELADLLRRSARESERR